MSNLNIEKTIPCFIRSLDNLENEEWRDVLGYDGIYNVSNYGRVKSLGRFVDGRNGRQKWIKEKILKQTIDLRHNEPNVKLSVNNVAKTFRVCTLVYYAFFRDKKEGEEVCHLNKNKIDNRISNLAIKTHSESQKISYKMGNMVNWGVESNPKKKQSDYLQKFGIYDNGQLVGKICSCCNSERDLNDFYKGNICKSCSLVKSGVKDLGKLSNRVELAKLGLRYCSVCKELKKLDSDFGKYKNGFMSKSNNCKSCVKKLNQNYRNQTSNTSKV